MKTHQISRQVIRREGRGLYGPDHRSDGIGNLSEIVDMVYEAIDGCDPLCGPDRSASYVNVITSAQSRTFQEKILAG